MFGESWFIFHHAISEHTRSVSVLCEFTDKFWTDGLSWPRSCGFNEGDSHISWNFSKAFLIVPTYFDSFAKFRAIFVSKHTLLSGWFYYRYIFHKLRNISKCISFSNVPFGHWHIHVQYMYIPFSLQRLSSGILFPLFLGPLKIESPLNV
jgi:hypothetical protein